MITQVMYIVYTASKKYPFLLCLYFVFGFKWQAFFKIRNWQFWCKALRCIYSVV